MTTNEIPSAIATLLSINTEHKEKANKIIAAIKPTVF
jgi:hypothetical protein